VGFAALTAHLGMRWKGLFILQKMVRLEVLNLPGRSLHASVPRARAMTAMKMTEKRIVNVERVAERRRQDGDWKEDLKRVSEGTI
jgi:hypothetical protein